MKTCMSITCIVVLSFAGPLFAGAGDLIKVNLPHGDLNRDGVVDSTDLDLMQGLFSDDPVAKSQVTSGIFGADMNGNGGLDVDDIIVLAQMVHGSRPSIKPATPRPTRILVGDVNADGEISLADAVALLRFVTQQSDWFNGCTESADINGDGRVDHFDLSPLFTYIFG